MSDDGYVIKRFASARHIRVRVKTDGMVLITAPLFTPKREIDYFLSEHRKWISDQQQKAYINQQSLTTERDSFLLRGKEYAFRLSINNTGERVELKKNILMLNAPDESHQTIRRLLETWYLGEAKMYFKPRALLLADVMGVYALKVVVRGQETRWGSCSVHKTLSLNWRLIMAPDWVSDYVIYHELAHLQQMNHSVKFWRIVTDYVPNYREAEKWLREHHKLLRF